MVLDRARSAAHPRGDGVALARRSRTTVVAAILGALSAVAAILFVVAPVDQRTSAYSWDLDEGVVTAAVPLSSYRPESLTVTVGCAQATRVGTIFSTVVPGSAVSEPPPAGLWIGARGAQVEVVLRGEPLLARPTTDLPCPFTVGVDATRADIVADGRTIGSREGDNRPEVAAFASGLPVDAPTAGLSARVVADTRFETTPTAAKVAAGAVSVALLVAALALVLVADRRAGGRAVRRSFGRGRPPALSDVAVLGGLVLWAVVGPMTVDDGYTTTMVADAARSGFVGGYHHWLNSPEAPFGSFYDFYRLWSLVSTELLWLRVPAALLGIISWALLSRAVLPRVISGMHRRAWPQWLAAVAFLSAWLPFCNGLRSEAWIVAGMLVTWCCTERAIATRRMLPLAVATLGAVLTMTIAPTALMAPLVLVVAAPSLWRVMRTRHDLALMHVLGVLAGCGATVLLVAFVDQTPATVFAGTELRQAIGPSLHWYEELTRYRRLLRTPDVEGSFGRRLPVLLMLLGLVVLAGATAARMRLVRVVGAPARRFVVLTVLALAGLAFAPTKWTHHFGAFAACATVVIVLTAWVGMYSLRSVAARAALVGTIAVAGTVSLAGAVAWWFPSGERIAWGAVPPSIRGLPLWAVAAAVAVACGLAALFVVSRPSSAVRVRRVLPSTGAALVVLLAGGLTIQTYGLVRAPIVAPGYTVGGSTAASVVGERCGIATAIQVEPDTAAGLLEPVAGPDGTSTTGGAMVRGVRADFLASPYDIPRDVQWQTLEGEAGQLTTGWYAIPPGSGSSGPLVVTAGGRGPAALTVDLGRRTPDGGVDPVDVVDIPLTDATVDRRVPVPDSSTADVVRLRAELQRSDAMSWVSVAAPRSPRLVPLDQVYPDTAAALLDWPVAPLMPCQRLASLQGGMAELPDFVFTSRPEAEATAQSAGGPFAMIENVADLRPVPTYVDETLLTTWSPQILAVVPRVPLRAPLVEVGSDEVSAFEAGPPLAR